MDVTRKIRFRGDPVLSLSLVQALEEEGVRVAWCRPEPEQLRKGIEPQIEAVVLGIVASGGYDAIKAGVALFWKRFWGWDVEVDIEGEDEDERSEPEADPPP
jgi:hypothetical protein